jgi:hypothetical protein
VSSVPAINEYTHLWLVINLPACEHRCVDRAEVNPYGEAVVCDRMWRCPGCAARGAAFGSVAHEGLSSMVAITSRPILLAGQKKTEGCGEFEVNTRLVRSCDGPGNGGFRSP